MRCSFCHTENTSDRTSCIACGTLLKPQDVSEPTVPNKEDSKPISKAEEPAKEVSSQSDQPQVSTNVDKTEAKDVVKASPVSETLTEKTKTVSQDVPINHDKSEVGREVPMDVVVDKSKAPEEKKLPPEMTPEVRAVPVVPPEIKTEPVTPAKADTIEEVTALPEVKPLTPELKPIGETDEAVLPEDDDEGGANPWLAIGIIAIIVILLAVGGYFAYVFFIKAEPEVTTEITKPELVFVEDVSDFIAEPLDEATELKWTSSNDPNADSLTLRFASDGETTKEIKLDLDYNEYVVDHLENGKEYTFTLFVEDIDQNRSSGVIVSVVPGTEVFVTDDEEEDEITEVVEEANDQDIQRKQDMEDLVEALESYNKEKGKYPEASNYKSLLNSLIKGKHITRLIQDPEFPDKEYTYSAIKGGKDFSFKVCFEDPDMLELENYTVDNDCITLSSSTVE